MASTSTSTDAPAASGLGGHSYDSIPTTPLTSKPNGRANGSIKESAKGSTADGQTEEDLWGEILSSVRSSRATPVKNIIVFGQPQTGKSTLLSHLAQSSPSSFLSDTIDVSDEHKGSNTQATNGQKVSSHDIAAADLGLGYGYFDVGDDDGEDTVARVGVYQVSSTQPAHNSLLPFAFLPSIASKEDSIVAAKSATNSTSQRQTNQDRSKGANVNTHPKPSLTTLRDSLFLITLDWEAPWTFLSQLLEWLGVIRDLVERAAASSSASEQGQWSQERVILDEMKEGIESYIRSYTEPQAVGNTTIPEVEELEVGETSTASAIVAVSNPTGLDDDEKAPLPEGCLSHNFGVPIVIVCTKADTITQLERQRNFKEEQLDYIQQVLRTVSLKYGAALFYTAQSRSQSYDILREYLLHRMFASNRHHSATSAFLFRHRASTVERDVLIVPSGWDSFGKIRALREGFDCESTANGWEWDVKVEQVRRKKNLPQGSAEAEEAAEQEINRRDLPGLVGSDVGQISSAVKLYEDIIEDWNAIGGANLSTGGHTRVKEPDQQAFLAQYYATLQQESEVRTKSSGQNARTGASKEESQRSGVVGPMGSSSLSLPSVEKIMQERRMSDENVRQSVQPSAKPTNPARQRGDAPSISTRQNINPDKSSPLLGSGERGIGSRPTSPLGAGAGSGSASPTPQHRQSEVLSSFFQSLLNKDKPAAGGGSRR